MNKLQGFLVLKKSGLPHVPWEKYNKDLELDKNILWTVRSAVAVGNDLNLPRRVGVSSYDAKVFAEELLINLDKNDLVIYYPYFIALKSGVIEISENRVVIEAVNADLWNLVTDNNKDVTIIVEDDDVKVIGDENFLTQSELLELVDYCLIAKKEFPNYIYKGKSILLEWSFACKSDISGNRVGNPSLIFYEIRSV